MKPTPETRLWLLAGVVVTAVTEGNETAITLTCTTAGVVTDVRSALAKVGAALQQAAQERREMHPCRP
jgi:hypothetical protein